MQWELNYQVKTDCSPSAAEHAVIRFHCRLESGSWQMHFQFCCTNIMKAVLIYLLALHAFFCVMFH